ncbi:phage Gp37/Gp68 family protein [Cypionkella sinensis]|uniref:Phage Gp37/Gp68 family protein n=1 Tax=Cypionkella sinensis TaxID=1756043 RepID=A0ABV7IZZ3_9RHOB
MADKSLIEWTDATWNPITGCTLVDDGCRHCYAAHLITSWPAIGNHPSREGLARKNAAGESKFTGEVRFNEQWLDQPLRWKKPRRIFVCAHGDLFHPEVPDEWIDKVFAVMALAPQHTFQVLTKRPERAREYLMGLTCDGARRLNVARMAGHLFGDEADAKASNRHWPMSNVWMLTSVSDQASANERIPQLLACPAAVRGISAEPLLGPVDLTLDGLVCLPCPASLDGLRMDTDTGAYECCSRCDYTGVGSEWGIDWVICGGESGPHARPMHPDWARSLRDQCVAAGVPFLFKQWGEWAADQIGPEDARSTRYPPGHVEFLKIGKKRAGRKLDGVEWSQFPEVAE